MSTGCQNTSSQLSQLQHPSALISVSIIEKNQPESLQDQFQLDQNLMIFLSQHSYDLLDKLKGQYKLPIKDQDLVRQNPIYRQLPSQALTDNEMLIPTYKKINLREPVYYKMLQDSLGVDLLFSLTWELDYKHTVFDELVVNITVDWVDKSGKFGSKTLSLSQKAVESEQSLLPNIVSEIKTQLYSSISTI